MKTWIALGMSCLLAGHAVAETAKAPPVPKDVEACVAAIADQRFCVETEASGFPINVRFYIVVDKETYPTVETLLDKYLAFDQWPAYTDTVGSDSIVFSRSARLDDLSSEDGTTIARHYYDYKLKSPIGYQKVRGVTYNTRLATPYAGAEGTIEFAAQTSGVQQVPAGEKPLTGAEGVKLQTGVINAVACTDNALCGEGQWLLTYESSITPAITLLPKVAAGSIQQGLETVLVGMLFN
jgi:hypothetical protein